MCGVWWWLVAENLSLWPTCAGSGFGVVIFGDESLRSALLLPDAVSALCLRAGSPFARRLCSGPLTRKRH